MGHNKQEVEKCYSKPCQLGLNLQGNIEIWGKVEDLKNFNGNFTKGEFMINVL